MKNRGAYCPECGRFEKGNINPDRLVRCSLCVQKRLVKIQRDEVEKMRVFDGPKIKTFREKMGFSQIEFARKIGMSGVHLSRLECGTVPLTEKWREKIFQVSQDTRG
jgi:DNA-binding transcriptional regulator YiaG